MRRLLAIGTLALGPLACSPFSVEVDEPLLCVSVSNQSFPGAPFGGTISTTVQTDLGSGAPFLTDKSFSKSLRLRSAKITSDGADLSGITQVKVEMEPPAGSSLKPALVADETKALPKPSTVIDLTTDPGIELVDYLSSTTLAAAVTVSGTPPPVPWTATVEACFHVNVSRSLP